MNEKRLPLLILILPVITITLTIIAFIYFYIDRQNKVLDKSLDYIEKVYIDKTIEIKKKDINYLFGVLENNRLNTIKELKSKLRYRVDLAYSIMMSIYKSDKYDKNLKNVIKNTISVMRFNDGAGYYFIYDMKGNCVLLPPHRSAEGKNFLNFKDIAGNNPVKAAVKIAKTKHSGFYEWYWYKPKGYNYSMKNEKMFKKMGYIKYFQPLDWFVGTGEYVDDEIKEIDNRFLLFYIAQKNYKNEHVVLLRDIETKPEILASTKGMKLKNLYKEGILKKVKLMIDKGSLSATVKYPAGGNSYYYDEVYFKYNKNLNITAVIDLQLQNVESAIENAKKNFKESFKKDVRNTILVFVFIILFIGILSMMLSRAVSSMFWRYQKKVEEHEKKLSELASCDELTNIYNRRRFDEILNYEIGMAKRYKDPLSLIMFDIDYFKKINDKYGHRAGDEVLKMIAGEVRKNIRETDTFARWGGEEFMLILPKTDFKGAVNIAENLRLVIYSADFGGIGKISCSFGVSQFNDSDDKNSFIERVDKAMYRAKELGRNRVESL